jgi:hypothetical protein
MFPMPRHRGSRDVDANFSQLTLEMRTSFWHSQVKKGIARESGALAVPSRRALIPDLADR